MLRPTRTGVLVPFAALLLILTGCTDAPGSDGGDPVTAPVTSAPTPTAAADDLAPADSDTTTEGDTGSAGASQQGSQQNQNNPQDNNQQQNGQQQNPPPAEPTVAPPTAVVTLAVQSSRCFQGAFEVTVTANYDNNYRKGITGVRVERKNEYGAWIGADATWRGPETGQGNQWVGKAPGSRTQRFEDEVRITATATGGATATATATVTGNC